MTFNAKASRSKRPCPIWVDAFQRDTQHLQADEIGAYFLILMAMWTRESCDFPDDDSRLARVSRVSVRLWKSRIGPAIREFLEVERGSVISKRLRQEATYVENEVQKQSDRKRGTYAKPQGVHDASEERGENPDKSLKYNKRHSTADNSADQPGNHPSQQPNNPTVGSGDDRRADDFSEPRERILKAIGVDPVTGITGHGGATLGTRHDMDLFKRWKSDLGLDAETIIAVISEVMDKKPDRRPPNSFRYFNPAMQREAGRKGEPALAPIKEDRSNVSTSRSRRSSAADDAFVRVINAAAGTGRTS